MATGGAPLDPDDLGGRLVLAQLALLDVDLARDAADIVRELITWPPGWFDLEAARIGHVAIRTSRHGRTARMQADLTAVAEAVTRRLGKPPILRPYAGGKRRQKPRVENVRAARRSALQRVLNQFPHTTAGEIYRTWECGPSTPGGLLRTDLGLHPQDRRPSESTLRKDLSEIA